MLGKVYQFAESVPVIGRPFRGLRYPLKRLVRYYLAPGTRKAWDGRIQDVLTCPDNAFIPRVSDAGKIVDGYLVMHNGLRIIPDGYCGEPMRLMLEKNRGAHEPQEERVFQEVLKQMPGNAVMVELGANWGFYSMWFHKEVKASHCFLVEPNPLCFECGRQHFALNRMEGKFIQAFVSHSSSKGDDGIATLCVDDLMRDYQLSRINILHSDIQGAEGEMLRGAEKSITSRKIDYIFISTHSDAVHNECLDFLKNHDFLILAESDLQNTYSFDGLIVARRKELEGLQPIKISQKTSG